MTKPITIIVAGDYELFRDGLMMMLRQIKDYKVIAEVETGTELLAQVREYEPDVVLMSVNLLEIDCMRVAKMLTEWRPTLGIVVLSAFTGEDSITKVLDAGARGHVLKTASKREIVEAIKAVYSGKTYYCSETAAKLTSALQKNKLDKHKQIPLLSERELKIIRYICLEKTNKEIAQELFLSPRTVEALRLHVLEKTNMKTVVGLAIYAIQTGLCSLNYSVNPDTTQ